MYRERIREYLQVYLVMDVSQGAASVKLAEDAIAGGVTMIQLREKKAKMSEVLAWGKELRELCRREQIPFVVNDRIDLALLLDADGVHVGQDDIPGLEARKLLGPDRIVGISAGTMEEAEIAMAQGADYLGVGAIYSTLTKGDAGLPIGTDLITRIQERWSDIPLVGIGGITADNAVPVIAAGADGVAVVSAITKAASPKQAAERLKLTVNKGILDKK
ncbi:thiamine phosphate synthase [Paenibacillus sp. GD4]|uniref:thiamine phosphate synthase n=1 Tax=Paenibacillus sp. GD4 TaxID=3068890 RepID=UPI0027968B38|nr:thiamine phosphate synthase [Paenibacillus sp. GD4]MDQ1913123.1 thiamine phosphate synthase [Paenibacillus sp. GD4]